MVFLCAALTGCALTPGAAHDAAAAHDARAQRAGLTIGSVGGDGFVHRTYSRADHPAGAAEGRALHVYFGGDGTPFLDRRRVARDPTPRRPVVLDLIAQDPHPAVVVGRPCYHGLQHGCDARDWTVDRYSDAVVRSMTAAVTTLIRAYQPNDVVLIGYSGGGVLAVLVAERLPAVSAVVTLAANLDIERWTTLHGYSPLTGSINPAQAAGTRRDLRHLHLVGARDRNVPPWLHDAMRRRVPWGEYRVLDGFDHRCCWTDDWHARLAQIEHGWAATTAHP